MNWIRHYLAQTGKPDAWLADRLGAHRQTISKVLRRPTVTQKWANLCAPILTMELGKAVTPINLMYGPDASLPGTLSSASYPVLVPVRGEAAAGTWRETGWETTVNAHVPVQAGKWPVDKQFAYKISGPSVENLGILDGDFVICVPYEFARSSPLDKDVVVVERHRDGLVEVSCKELRVVPGALELWPHSNDPKYQAPLRLADDAPDDEFTTYKIAGLVIALHRPMA